MTLVKRSSGWMFTGSEPPSDSHQHHVKISETSNLTVDPDRWTGCRTWFKVFLCSKSDAKTRQGERGYPQRFFTEKWRLVQRFYTQRNSFFDFNFKSPWFIYCTSSSGSKPSSFSYLLRITLKEVSLVEGLWLSARPTFRERKTWYVSKTVTAWF